MDLLFNFIVLGQLILVAASIYWFFNRNDELPLIISGLTMIFSSYRFFAVSQGFAQWVETAYTFGLDYITDDDAFQSLIYISTGELVLLLTYFATMRERIPLLNPKKFDPRLLPRPTLVIAAAFGTVLFAEQSRDLFSETGQNNYLFLFPLTQIGMSILIATFWVHGGIQTRAQKLACLVFFALAAYTTFGIILRFQFFGLLVAVALTFTASMEPRRRLSALGMAVVLGAFLFGASGALRTSDNTYDKVAGLTNTTGAFDRLLSAEDANMLDGFTIVRQVYPALLDYSWGQEHFEILLRPIPRSLWPDKPVGGFVNKLGMRDTEKDGNLGISPSIFGSFYAEGGLIGIILFSIVYGFAFSKAATSLARSHPFVNVMGRAVFLSWLVPLLRGGDVPGIYSWLGMSMLPVLVYFYLKRTLLFKRFQRRGRQIQPTAEPQPQLLPETPTP